MPKVDPNKNRKGMIVMLGCNDTDHAGCQKYRRSVSSKTTLLDGWKCQSIETISSGEAEFYGLTDVVLETKPTTDVLK